MPICPSRRLSLLLCCAVLCCCGLLACGEEARTPEEQVRHLLDEAEQQAEARDVSGLKAHISEHYFDGRGFNRESIGALMAYYLSSYETVHLLTRVAALSIEPADRASVTLLVGMAGHPFDGAAGEEAADGDEPVESADDLVRLNADLYRFDLTFIFEEDQGWRVRQAQWQRAQPGDFF